MHTRAHLLNSGATLERLRCACLFLLSASSSYFSPQFLFVYQPLSLLLLRDIFLDYFLSRIFFCPPTLQSPPSFHPNPLFPFMRGVRWLLLARHAEPLVSWAIKMSFAMSRHAVQDFHPVIHSPLHLLDTQGFYGGNWASASNLEGNGQASSPVQGVFHPRSQKTHILRF